MSSSLSMVRVGCNTFVSMSMFWWFAAFFCFSVLNTGISHEPKKPFNLNFHQDDYKIKFEWGEIVRYNKRFVTYIALNIFKYNRTCTAGNLTLEYNINIGKSLEVILQVYKFTSSNDYRQFPIRVQANFCEAMSKNVMGALGCLTCGNFSGCPLLKNHRYHVCNFVPDGAFLPPFIPTGRYKLEFQMLYHNEELWVGNSYGEVYRPFVK